MLRNATSGSGPESFGIIKTIEADRAVFGSSSIFDSRTFITFGESNGNLETSDSGESSDSEAELADFARDDDGESTKRLTVALRIVGRTICGIGINLPIPLLGAVFGLIKGTLTLPFIPCQKLPTRAGHARPNVTDFHSSRE
jgi:hypothetical protein